MAAPKMTMKAGMRLMRADLRRRGGGGGGGGGDRTGERRTHARQAQLLRAAPCGVRVRVARHRQAEQRACAHLLQRRGVQAA
jgi:hypothetical protein